MKPEQIINDAPDKTTIVNQRQVDYEKKLIGRVHKHNGHTFFEIDCSTGEIKEADYKQEKIEFVDERCLITGEIKCKVAVKTKDVDCKENCLYIAALNKKSARKKYFKWLIEQGIKRKQK